MYVGNICVRMSFEWEEKLKETYNSPLGKTTWERCPSKQKQIEIIVCLWMLLVESHRMYSLDFDNSGLSALLP